MRRDSTAVLISAPWRPLSLGEPVEEESVEEESSGSPVLFALRACVGTAKDPPQGSFALLEREAVESTAVSTEDRFLRWPIGKGGLVFFAELATLRGSIVVDRVCGMFFVFREL